MCGRARCSLSPEAILQLLQLDNFKDPGHHYKPSFNAAPQSYQPVVLLEKDDTEKRVVMAMKWGLVPSFFAPEKQNMNDLRTINARVENLTTGGMWRRLVDKRRCVIVSEGYYEWRVVPGQRKKQPFFIHVAGAKLTLLAGLYDVWAPKGNMVKKEEKGGSTVKKEEGAIETEEKLFSYSVVTTEPLDDIRHIHDRMPLILDTDEKVEKWLHPEKHPFSSIIKDILPASQSTVKASPLQLEYFEVPSIVGSVQNDGPECCMPLSEWQKKGINSFFVKKEEKSGISDSTTTLNNAKVKEEPSASSSAKKRASPSFDDYNKEKEEEEEEPQSQPLPKKRKTASPSQATTKRERCLYGSLCFRKSPLHAKEFAHPNDADWEED